jgi:type IV secretion system protein VirB2
MVKSSNGMGRTILFVLGLVLLLSVDAFAQLAIVESTLGKIQTALRTLSVVTVTLAFLYVGYKILFGGSTFKEVAPVIIGALIIASCSEAARLLVG